MTDMVSKASSRVTMIPPDTRLKDKIARHAGSLSKLIDHTRIQQAEEALRNNQDVFIAQAEKELVTLQTVLERWDDTTVLSKEDQQLLMESVFRLKSLAGMFGFQLASKVGRQLYRYLENNEELGGGALVVVQSYSDSIRSILHYRITGDGGEQGKELLLGLAALVKKHG